MIPFAPYIENNFLLLYDNARCHVALRVRDYLDEVGIKTMSWPPCSPDLNPIENLGGINDCQLRSRHTPPVDLECERDLGCK